MARIGAIGAGRRMAESLMTDTCRITKPGAGQGAWNPSTGSYDAPVADIVYEGACRLKSPALVNPFTSTGAAEAWQVEESVLSIPASAPSVERGMTVTYLSSPTNPALAGRVFGVVGPHRESQATAQRILVRETVGAGS